MSCSGLHCAGCAGGMAIPVVPLVAFCGLAWVAEHLIEVAAVSVTCAVMAVAIVAWLIRWQDRRQARFGPLMVTRADVPALTATVIPQVKQAAPPAIEQHVHYHVHVASAPQAAGVLTALPGTAGDATDERK